MKKLLILLLFPLMMFAQDSTITGDVDCDGEVTSQDASLILQFVTSVIDELPCEENMNGLTPDQLQEIINMMDEQLNISYSGGGGSNYPAMISSISPNEMYIGDALIYCSNLEEDGYTDWFLPNADFLAYAISGGCEYPDERTSQFLWTTTKFYSGNNLSTNMVISEAPGSGNMSQAQNGSLQECRCVRFGDGETSEGSSGSSNSSGSSILGNSEQPITMIGPMYKPQDFPEFTISYVGLGGETQIIQSYAMNWYDASRFCSQLEYNGYGDWFLPSIEQIIQYINDYSIIVIDNFDFLTDNNINGVLSFWSNNIVYEGTPTANLVNLIPSNFPAQSETTWNGTALGGVDISNRFYGLILSTAYNTNFSPCFCVR